jgi:protein NrfD
MITPSSTFFTTPPEWHVLVVLYFFFGGLAGGSFFIAALADLFGRPRDWPLAKLGYYVAFLALLPCPIFLILDLTHPERFWHMLLQDHTFLPAFKYWSPMSVGSWGLVAFSGLATLAALGALASDRNWRPFLFLRHGVVRTAIAALGGLAGFFLAGYTGVLLAVTNRPIWADTNLIGLLFIASAATTSAALLTLLGHRHGAMAMDTLHRLARMETLSSLLELVALVALVLSLGGVARALFNSWGALLAAAALIGIVAPLVLHSRPRFMSTTAPLVASALVLVGGLMLRAAVIYSAQAV